jgi:hypothetical protein
MNVPHFKFKKKLFIVLKISRFLIPTCKAVSVYVHVQEHLVIRNETV